MKVVTNYKGYTCTEEGCFMTSLSFTVSSANDQMVIDDEWQRRWTTRILWDIIFVTS